MRSKLVQGVDYYVEGGKFVFTALYHLKRGHCCNSRCRHCPYGLAPDPEQGKLPAFPPIVIKPLIRK
jgi:hypothetical protein